MRTDITGRRVWRHGAFEPREHEPELLAIFEELERMPEVSSRSLGRVLRRHPKGGTALFSRSELIAGLRHLADARGWSEERTRLVESLRRKPVRSLSGVTPVTILTKPFPCPGKCIFCPNDVRMPKSYLSREPGAQRAGMHGFDPYEQTFIRLQALYQIGHPVDKIELIVLGGTWSFYPEPYQIWFLKRTFDALNDFGSGLRGIPEPSPRRVDFGELDEVVDGSRGGNPYNRIVSEFVRAQDPEELASAEESASWAELFEAQRRNEASGSRLVGLSLETRPDHVSEGEVRRLRRLGATKIQIGYQSLDDDVLALNQRGHDVASSRRATALLRRAGFKIQAHWMANLYGSTPEKDVEDFRRLFEDPAFRPDELKLYPCSLVETAELMAHYEAGRFRPYTEAELLEVLVECMTAAPPYCRLTRVIRDIPGDDIYAGSRITNFRAVAETEIARRGHLMRDIRAREIRGRSVPVEALRLDVLRYETSAGDECFFQFVTDDDRVAGFLRLALPRAPAFIDELENAALLREVHVYGAALGLGEREKGKAQHAGLGRRLVERAAQEAREGGYADLAVISSVGTREYYRRLGFTDGELYQHLKMGTGTIFVT